MEMRLECVEKRLGNETNEFLTTVTPIAFRDEVALLNSFRDEVTLFNIQPLRRD